MRQRLLGVAVVVASACTALHYSQTRQQSVSIANNPYTYPAPGSQTFIIGPAGSADHDILQTIVLNNCDSQWTLDTSIDPQQPVMGAHVCGFGGGSAQATQSDLILCPRNYQFAVSYSGAIPGLSSCLVEITSMDYFGSGINPYTLMLDGTGSAGSGISVTPKDGVYFGSVQINTTSAAQMVTVKNNGTTSLLVNGYLQASGFMVTPNPSSFSLNGGSSTDFYVTCTPTTVGPLGGSFDFSVGGIAMGSVPLSCEGIDSTVTVQPGAVTFANTLVGRAPATKVINIGGNASEVIQSVTLDTDAMTNGVTLVQDPTGLQIGAGQQIELAYDAAVVHPAGQLGSLAIQFGTEPARNVGISGQALLGGVGTNPATVELGAVCVGGAAVKDVEVYASEAGDVVVSMLTPPGPPFAASITDSLPKTLAGSHTGPSIMVHTGIAPTTPGEFTDAFSVSSDVPNKPTTEVQLHGIALAGGIAATPDVVHFGTTAPGTTTSIKEVQLTNCGSGNLMFTSASITGADASEFTLIGANPPRTLLPTESERFMVVMQPDTGGFKIAQLVIQHSEGATTVDLDGTGDGGGPKDRETYYACSTGRGAALWPIALALVLLRRRRRA